MSVLGPAEIDAPPVVVRRNTGDELPALWGGVVLHGAPQVVDAVGGDRAIAHAGTKRLLATNSGPDHEGLRR